MGTTHCKKHTQHTHTYIHTHTGSSLGGQTETSSVCLQFDLTCLDDKYRHSLFTGMFHYTGKQRSEGALFSTGGLVKQNASTCVFLRLGVFESLKHPVAAVLHICLTAVTTGKPQLSLQSQLKCYEAEFSLFLYLFIPPGRDQPDDFCKYTKLAVSTRPFPRPAACGKL